MRGDPPQHRFTTVEKTLWSDVDRRRIFLIPDDWQPPLGDLLLRSCSNREMQVDADALAAFEVTAEQAGAWLTDQLLQVAGTLGTRLWEAFLGPLREVRDPTETATAGDPSGKRSNVTPGLYLLAELTGTPRHALTSDYPAISHALRTYLSDVSATASDAVSGEPERMDAARERMRFWAETLRDHGVAVPDPASADPEQRETAQQATYAGNTSPTAEKNEPSAGGHGAETRGLADRLRRLAEAFRRRADEIAAAREGANGQPAAPGSSAAADSKTRS